MCCLPQDEWTFRESLFILRPDAPGAGREEVNHYMAKSPCTTEHPELTFVFGQTRAVHQAVDATKPSSDDRRRVEAALREEIKKGGGFPLNYTFVLEAAETCHNTKEAANHGNRTFSVEVRAGEGGSYALAKMCTIGRAMGISTGKYAVYTHPETFGSLKSCLDLFYATELHELPDAAQLLEFIESKDSQASTNEMPDKIAELLIGEPLRYACWKGGLGFTVRTWPESMLDGGRPPSRPSTSIDIRCAFSGAPQDDDLGKFLPRLLSAALNELLKIWCPNYTIQNNLNSKQFVEKAKSDPALREALIYLANHVL